MAPHAAQRRAVYCYVWRDNRHVLAPASVQHDLSYPWPDRHVLRSAHPSCGFPGASLQLYRGTTLEKAFVREITVGVYTNPYFHLVDWAQALAVGGRPFRRPRGWATLHPPSVLLMLCQMSLDHGHMKP